MKHDINDMMVFLAVVESGSFTIAAERLGIPKANVSRKVSRLESQLGVTLLERSTRSQQLTEAGKIYLTHCKRIHEEIDLAEAAISGLLSSHKGVIKVGASVAIGQQILKPALASFLDRYPEINLQLSLVNQRLDLIEEGFDMLIRVGDLEDSRLIAKPLGRAQRKLYVSSAYLLKHGQPQNINELCDHSMLLMSRFIKGNKLELFSGTEQQTIVLKPRLLVDDFSIIKQAVMDDEGIAILPEYMCQQEMSSGQLHCVLPEWNMPAIDIYALYPQHRVNIPKVKAFLDFAVETFSKVLDT